MAGYKGKTAAKRDLNGVVVVKTCTPMEGRFAKAYALHGGLSAAYGEAGYALHATDKDIDHNNARLVIARAHVFAEYERWKAEFAQRIDISDNRILAEMAAIGFVNSAHILDEYGAIQGLEDMQESVQRSIKKIKVRRRVIVRNTKAPDEDITETETLAEDIIEIEFHDKLKALMWIADINGMKPVEAPPEINVNVKIDGKLIAGKGEEY